MPAKEESKVINGTKNGDKRPTPAKTKAPMPFPLSTKEGMKERA